MSLKSLLNWRVKIVCKIILAHLPIPYAFWKKIALFEHGFMDDPQYVFDVFHRHYDRVEFANKNKGWTGLELGPGDSIAAGIIAYAYGAKKTYLVDVGRYVSDDVALYQNLVTFLQGKGLDVPNIEKGASFESVLAQFNIDYLTSGNESLAQIKGQSIDFCWSQAVLEHVRRDDFQTLANHAKRVIKPDGAHSHRVDLKDHLASSLNNLRFSPKIWESNLFARSGFYTNRIQFTQMLDMFKTAGLQVETPEVNHWDTLPLSKNKMYSTFRSLSDEELNVSGFDFVGRQATY